MNGLLLTYEAAEAAYFDGERDWSVLSRNLPRNSLPALLGLVADELSIAELAGAVGNSWVMCEFPENALPRSRWLEWFRELDYTENGALCLSGPPSRITLYRGGIDPSRMAWTDDRAQAEWFCDRFPGGRLWTAEASSDRILAHFNTIRNGEREYVIDPDGLSFTEIKPC